VGLFDGPGKAGDRSVELNHLAFRVDVGSYDEITAALTAEGVEFRGRPGDERCIYFSDPDGNTLQIMPADE
jgi:catechol 2,3-dioxygenase-like lactoylglutathione lyase family enzyme